MNFFYRRYNDLEKYLLGRSYSEKMVHKKMLRARAIPRDAHLVDVNNKEKQNKITFNIKYYPVFCIWKDFRSITYTSCI